MGDRTFNEEIFNSSIFLTESSSIRWPTGYISFSSKSKIGSAITLPSILSVRGCIISPPSTIDETIIDCSVPQSSSTTTESMATSHNLRVKYPELAVFKAVSARPFLAP